MTKLESRGIIPTRILNGPFMGSMNMPGISLSLLNLTNVAEECSFVDTSKLIGFLDAPHNSVAWPATSQIYPLPEKLANRKREDKFVDAEEEKKEEITGGPQLFGKCLVLLGCIDGEADSFGLRRQAVYSQGYEASS